MANSRKDSKGRVLRKGESQRTDGLYQYRYTDHQKKRQIVYARTLNELREKENEINKALSINVNYAAGKITTRQLLDMELKLKDALRDSTQYNSRATYNRICKHASFIDEAIINVKTSMCKQFVTDLRVAGYSYNTINSTCAFCKAAFRLACDDEIIPKNPFDFRLRQSIQNDTKKRTGITPDEQRRFFDFVKNSNYYNKRLDLFVFMVETGLRIGELSGLTFSDIDWKNNCININHQLIYASRGNETRAIGPPKTNCGYRKIYLSSKARAALQNIVKKRQEQHLVEPMISGYTGFVFLTRRGTVINATIIDSSLRYIVNSYNKSHTDKLPHISAHTLRHTFCSNCVNAGMSVKTVQYLMGHSNASVTLDVYADVNIDQIADEMLRFNSCV